MTLLLISIAWLALAPLADRVGEWLWPSDNN